MFQEEVGGCGGHHIVCGLKGRAQGSGFAMTCNVCKCLQMSAALPHAVPGHSNIPKLDHWAS